MFSSWCDGNAFKYLSNTGHFKPCLLSLRSSRGMLAALSRALEQIEDVVRTSPRCQALYQGEHVVTLELLRLMLLPPRAGGAGGQAVPPHASPSPWVLARCCVCIMRPGVGLVLAAHACNCWGGERPLPSRVAGPC